MDIAHYIAHPEQLNQDTLYDLRQIVGAYPAYHAARILMVRNLFLLHDPTFDREMRRAALLVPDRRVLFALTQPAPTPAVHLPRQQVATATVVPVKADPRSDYMSYLMQQEGQETETVSNDRLDDLITEFINAQSRGIRLQEHPMVPDGIIDDPDETPLDETEDAAVTVTDDGAGDSQDSAPIASSSLLPPESGDFSAALVTAYTKQGRYDRALEMMQRMQGTAAAQSNPYYADQVRFLQKLAYNQRKIQG